jgi:hypothetical protein
MIEFFMRRSALFILSLLVVLAFSYYLVKGDKGIRLDVHQKGESFIEGLKLVHWKNGSSDRKAHGHRDDAAGKRGHRLCRQGTL